MNIANFPMTFAARLGTALVVLACALAGCASFQVEDTRPLPESRLEPLGAERISRGGYRLDVLPPSPEAPDLIVMVAMSGGGKRSASFAYGALKGMRDVSVATVAGPRSLLSQIDYMSGVSGGSFPAGYYGLYRDAMFGRFETDFLYDDTNAYIYGVYLLPWNWTWLVESGIGTNDFMDRVYDRTMFRGATFRDLEARGRPVIAIGATDVSYGTPFQFTQETFDLICADLSPMPISRAVAASNGFPGLFSPITLTNHAARCGGRRPGWLDRVGSQVRRDPLSRVGVEVLKAERYLDPARTRYLHLSDGGVADNLAMRSAGATMQTIAATDVRKYGLVNVRRLLLISVDGQGSQDDSVARRKEIGGLMSLLGLVSGGQIDSYNLETMVTVTAQLQILTDVLREARCGMGRLVNGAPCDDVRSALLHVSLAKLPETSDKGRLLAIPTGLTVARPDVDLLVRAGHDAITGSAALRAFLDSYRPLPAPIVPLPAPPDRRGG